MILVLGVGVGLWLVMAPLPETGGLGDANFWIYLGGGVLGGASLVGVPMLLIERRRRPGRRWGPGRLLWFAHGTAAWLLWPPVVPVRLRGPRGQPVMGDVRTAEVCFFYGTPLMAVYVSAALLAGGWFRRGRRRRHLSGRGRPADWRERFGLMLGLAWLSLGLLVLWLIHADSLFR